MKKRFNYVYITTNLVNNKQYIGDHSCDDLQKDKYLGSGLYLKRALNEYKIENFKKEILEFFNTKEDAFNAQEKYIKQFNTLVPNGYNISPKGGHGVKDCISQETREKLSKALKNRPLGEETKIKMRKPKSEDAKINIGVAQKNKKLSPEHIENIRKSRIGGHGPNSGKHFNKISRKYF